MVLGSVGSKSTGITGKLRLLVYKGLKMSGGNIQKRLFLLLSASLALVFEAFRHRKDLDRFLNEKNPSEK